MALIFTLDLLGNFRRRRDSLQVLRDVEIGFRLAQDGIRSKLGAIVGNDDLRPAANADEHRQLACNPFARDRGVGDSCQTFARDIIDNVEDAGAPALGELVVDEVKRPARIDLGFSQDRRACSDRFSPNLALADRQTFLAVQPIDAIDT
jgi:hypothetical protein